ncbi:MAG: hypothetical protein AAF127_15630 [Pseudomonadota bacterium]
MRVLLATLGLLTLTANTPAPEGDLHPVTGDWVVDLRLSLKDAPYTQPMRLDVAEDNSVAGTFYGSPISKGRLGEAQGRSCIAFRTSDNSGPYQHAACLVDGKLVGQSWSEGRDFPNPWTAERKK